MLVPVSFEDLGASGPGQTPLLSFTGDSRLPAYYQLLDQTLPTVDCHLQGTASGTRLWAWMNPNNNHNKSNDPWPSFTVRGCIVEDQSEQ